MEINRSYYLTLPLVSVLKHCISLLLVLTTFNSVAFFEDDDNSNNKLSKTSIEYHQKDNVTNQIPYFDNRFRIDADLDEITLIFYRKSGSTPIILIRPDGSKIRVNNIEPEKVQWFDDSTFDMIKIKKPMPGPWQAVGDILPNSQILVVSNIKITVEPLPDIAFSGETLKVEGKLFNDEDAINSPYFKKVVNLDVNFYSTNNSQYENFGADAIKVTSFRDDGYDLDEYANDNIFTGEFVLDFAPGEWQPVYLVKLPMSIRELRQTPILLQKTPVEISVVKSAEVDKPHQITLSIDPTYVAPNSLVFQGTFTYPDRQTEPFSVMEGTGVTRLTNVANTEPGIYRVNVSAFGETTTGREFRLVIPEYSFNVEASESGMFTTDDDGSIVLKDTSDDSLMRAAQEKEAALMAQQLAKEEKDQEVIIMIAAGNGVILLVALILFIVLRRNKKNKKT